MTTAVPALQDETDFRQFAEFLPQIIWICSADGLCVYLSPRWQEYTGMATATQLDTHWLSQVHPDDREQVAQDWMAAVNAGHALKKDFRIRRHDDVFHWFAVHGVPIRDASGQILHWLGSCTDIQDRIEARDALLLSEQRFRSLYHSAPVSIWVEDWSGVMNALPEIRTRASGDYGRYFSDHPEDVTRLLNAIMVLDVNDWTMTVFRAERKEQLLGSLSRLVASPAAREAFVRKLIAIAQGARSLMMDMELCAMDGSLLYVQSSMAVPSPGAHQNLVMVACVDITERYRIEAELQAQRRLLDNTSRLAKVGGWTVDVATMQGTWTAETVRIHDLPPGTPVNVAEGLSFYTPESREVIAAAVKRAIEHVLPYDLELTILTAAKALKWVRTQGMPVVENGAVVRLEGTMQDITDRKHAELALQSLNEGLERQVAERTAQLEHARQDLQGTLDAIPAIVVYLDHELRARYANLAANRYLGRPVDEVRGKTFAEIVGVQQYQRRKIYFDAALQGVTQTFDAELPARDGQPPRFAQIHFVPHIRDGRVIGLYMMLFDITELTNAQTGLLAANHELEAFSYAVAHDLRAPLRAMNGFSCALLEDCAGSLDEAGTEYAREIVSASNKMSDLLDGLLTLSRSTQGEMRRDRVDLSQLARKICLELQQLEPGRKVHWQVDPGLCAVGDVRMLEPVIRNLLGNAWKYTGRVAAPEITFKVQRREAMNWFCVADNGAGFDMAHVDRLFKPFQRLHRQDEFTGIGIGLATVQRIVSRHGGQMQVDAAPGGGARFFFTLGSSPAQEVSSGQDIAAG